MQAWVETAWKHGLGDRESRGSKSSASGGGVVSRNISRHEWSQRELNLSVLSVQSWLFPQPGVLLLMGCIRVCCHNSRCVQQLRLEFPSKNTAKFGGNADGSIRNASAAHCQQAGKAHLEKVPCKHSKSILIWYPPVKCFSHYHLSCSFPLWKAVTCLQFTWTKSNPFCMRCLTNQSSDFSILWALQAHPENGFALRAGWRVAPRFSWVRKVFKGVGSIMRSTVLALTRAALTNYNWHKQV